MPQYLIDLQSPSFTLKSRSEIGYTLPDKLYEDAALLTRSYDISNRVHDQLSYAVLSHRWGVGEPDFRTISEMGGVTAAVSDPRYADLPGFKKLQNFCLKVQSLGFNYAWTDTCCIDKRSSAELQEALNSMYQWYDYASFCIAYLGQAETLEELAQDEWFTRGWTLQELLAPTFLVFYKKDWEPLDPENVGRGRGNSDKLSYKVAPIIEAATGISSEFLRGFYPGDYSVKLIIEIMSWAAHRTTERPEDIAYCLLGIFNVTMPILYGEGEIAFFRLQKELIKRTPDWTVFFW
ncbi:heterokaryon incompatibility protein-domain-containing protein, partial [Collybia nuda]